MSLKALRRDRGWSQEELARISDLSVRTIQRFEAGDPPGLEAIKALATSFDLSVEEMRDALAADPAARFYDAFFDTAETRRWAPLFWHSMIYLTVLVVLTLIVAQLDTSPRIALGLGMLWGGDILVHLALVLGRARPA